MIAYQSERVKRVLRRMPVVVSYALLIIFVLSAVQVHAIWTYTKRWSGAQMNLVVVEKVFSDLKDMESGQRGYIITGDQDYLAQYNAGSAAISYDLKVLNAYMLSNLDQRASLLEMDDIISKKLAELEHAIDEFKLHGFPAAQEVIRTNKGAEQMKHIRFLMDVIRAREQASIKQSGIGL